MIRLPLFPALPFGPALSALSLAAMLSLSAAPAGAATPDDVLVVGGQIDDMIGLDPAQIMEFGGSDVANNLYDKLVAFASDSPADGVVPHLAESWQVSDDGLSITFTIRQGVRFHSGNPVRAEDAAWSLKRAVRLDKTPAFVLTQFGLTPDNVDDRIVADGNRLTLHLDRPYAPDFVLACMTANAASVLDKDLIMAHGGDDLGHDWLTTHEAGSGPFTLTGWRPNESVTLTAFDDHWQGKPAMRRVVVRHIQESAAQRLQLERGDIDVARDLIPSDIQAVAGNDALRVDSQLRNSILYLGLNQKDPLLSNPAVVAAMRHLVDYDGIANSLLKGQFTPHQSFVPLGHPGVLEDRPWAYDIEKARQILKDAGIGGGTITTKVRDIPEYIDTAQALQNAMAQVGLVLNIQPVAGAQVLDAYRARDLALFIGERAPDYPDSQAPVRTFAWNPDNSDAAQLRGSIAWRNSFAVPQAMNDAVEAAQVQPDPAQRAETYRAIQRDWRDSAPIIPMFQRTEQTAMQADVQHWNSGGSVTYRQVTKDRAVTACDAGSGAAAGRACAAPARKGLPDADG
ncbi:ABC transporter substrate-binding protein [Paracoccus jiaweipingae]|uniref:ABC transporter substrate-binding protein n=1 Tax=Paracoccus sp. p2-l61 TaxID=3366950 RepID=UPI0037B6DC80